MRPRTEMFTFYSQGDQSEKHAGVCLRRIFNYSVPDSSDGREYVRVEMKHSGDQGVDR